MQFAIALTMDLYSLYFVCMTYYIPLEWPKNGGTSQLLHQSTQFIRPSGPGQYDRFPFQTIHFHIPPFLRFTMYPIDTYSNSVIRIV